MGNLDDDNSTPEVIPLIREIKEGVWCIQGNTPLDDVVHALRIKFDDVEDIDTFGGLVFDMLETIPDDEEKPILEGHGLHIEVNEILSRRVVSANVWKMPEVVTENKVGGV